MKNSPIHHLFTFMILFGTVLMIGCNNQSSETKGTSNVTAEEILSNPVEYPAISYSGYRELTLDSVPSIPELKEDMKILSAMGIKIVRTYKVYLDAVPRLLQAIEEMKQEDPEFEMYVMMGAWIDAKNAWTDEPDRIRGEDSPRNAEEIDKAVALANKYPDIVKVIAVGNEAMVHWQTEYYVEPGIILRWVNHLQNLKSSGDLPESLWITSSDNFASWGGGDSVYHKDALNELIRAVDYISMHTYPMHDTHYNPDFWGVRNDETDLSDMEKIESAMQRALEYATSQYQSVVEYMEGQGVNKQVHIGETGWATVSNEFYGDKEARATDEFKMARYYDMIREWSDENEVSVFYFEAFDEKWKDAENQLGSENHFGLINLQSEAKYVLWDEVDAGVFEGLTRDGMPITKTYNGDYDAMMEDVKVPPTEQEIEERLQSQSTD